MSASFILHIWVYEQFFLNIAGLYFLGSFGTENAIKYRKVLTKRCKTMLNDGENVVLTTQEACHYLRISRPTYLKYIYMGKIRGAKAGKGWKVLKSELDRFLRGESNN